MQNYHLCDLLTEATKEEAEKGCIWCQFIQAAEQSACQTYDITRSETDSDTGNDSINSTSDESLDDSEAGIQHEPEDESGDEAEDYPEGSLEADRASLGTLESPNNPASLASSYAEGGTDEWETGRDRRSHTTYVSPSWSWLSHNHGVFYTNRGAVNSSRPASITFEVIPENPQSPNGAIRSATLTIRCRALAVESVTDVAMDFYFDDIPTPNPLGKMIWLLHIEDEEPYNNPHPIGIGIVELDRASNPDQKLYRRVGMFHDGRMNFDNYPIRELKIV